MRRLLLATVFALGTLALTACPEEGKGMIQEAREEVANEVGGAPKRQVDEAKARIDAATKAQAERLEQMPTE